MAEILVDSPTRPEVIRDAKGLRVRAVAGKAGVNVYQMPDGSVRRELRHPDHLTDAASLATLKMLPVTLQHPPSGVLPLSVANGTLARYSRGHTGEEITFEGGKLYVNLRVTDPVALDAIERGVREISPGYERVAIHDPGVWEGEPYDYIQTQIRYDHLAVVDEARAGHDVRLLLDGHVLEDSMEKFAVVLLDGMEHRVDSGVAVAVKAALDKQQATIDTLKGQLDAQTARATAAESAKAAAEALVTDAADSKKIAEGVKAHLELVRQAQPIVGELALDSFDGEAIKAAVVAKVFPELVDNYSKGNASYQAGLYDSAVKQASKKAESAHQVVKDSLDNPVPVKAVPTLSPREKFIAEQNANARKPLSELIGGRI